jgi:hypothetical protein
MMLPSIADSYLADMQVNGGNSGGPVYRVAEGGVIGVGVASRGAPTWTPDGRSTAQRDDAGPAALLAGC